MLPVCVGARGPIPKMKTSMLPSDLSVVELEWRGDNPVVKCPPETLYMWVLAGWAQGCAEQDYLSGLNFAREEGGPAHASVRPRAEEPGVTWRRSSTS